MGRFVERTVSVSEFYATLAPGNRHYLFDTATNMTCAKIAAIDAVCVGHPASTRQPSGTFCKNSVSNVGAGVTWGSKSITPSISLAQNHGFNCESRLVPLPSFR